MFPDPDLRGPNITLGLLWAIGVAATLVVGPVLFALLLGTVAALAAAQTARTWRRARPPRAPLPPAAMAAAAVVGLGALLGVAGLVVVAVLAAIGAAAWTVSDAVNHGGRPSTVDALLTLACAAVPAAAVAGPILLRRHGLESALVLMAYALVYDAGSWTMGSGSRHRWLGPLAGIACIASVTVAVAAFAPQFRGNSPWELGVLAAVLAPLGPAAASLVVGDRRVPVRALHRLDSLVLLGPIWAIAASRIGV